MKSYNDLKVSWERFWLNGKYTKLAKSFTTRAEYNQFNYFLYCAFFYVSRPYYRIRSYFNFKILISDNYSQEASREFVQRQKNSFIFRFFGTNSHPGHLRGKRTEYHRVLIEVAKDMDLAQKYGTYHSAFVSDHEAREFTKQYGKGSYNDISEYEKELTGREYPSEEVFKKIFQ